MDKTRLAFVLGLATWVLAKLYGLGSWTWEQSNQVGILLNLAWLTGLAGYAAYCHRSLPAFIVRWKSTAKSVVLYSLLLTCTMGVWYYAVVPETIQQRKQEQLALLEEFVNDPSELAVFQGANSALKTQSPEQILEQQAANLELFFSPMFFLGTVLMVWIFSAALISALTAAAIPRIWNDTRRPVEK